MALKCKNYFVISDKSPLQYSPTCSSWHPDNEHIVAVADETGAIVVKDIRKGVDFCTSYTAHSRFVQQVQFCPSKWVAYLIDMGSSVVFFF